MVRRGFNSFMHTTLSTPAISVLIPIYNAERYLAEALSSLHEQKYSSIEFICINDGSTDGSRGIVQSFLDKDARFKVIDKENSGYGSSLNQAIKQAQGEYISIFEPDDFIEGEMFGCLYTLAQKTGFPDIVKSAYWSIDEEENRFHCGYWGRIKHVQKAFRIEDEPLLTRYHPSIWSALYKKDFLSSQHISFKEVPGAGWVDNPFMAETLLKAHSIVYTNDSFYCYRDAHEGSSTANIAHMEMPLERWLEMTEIFLSQGVSNRELWSIHSYKAFHYLDYAKQAKDYQPAAWESYAKVILEKLSPELVAYSQYLSPAQKQQYTSITGKELHRVRKLPYYGMLLNEAYWKIRQNGFKFMLRRAISS